MGASEHLHRNDTPPCGVCKAFHDAATYVKNLNDANPADPVAVTSEKPRQWKLGSTEEIFGVSSCTKHQPILAACLTTSDREGLTGMSLDFFEGRVSLLVGTSREDETWYSSPAEFVVNDSFALPQVPGVGLGRVLDREYIDPALVRQWKADCTAHHGDKCSETLLRLQEPFAFLIDCEKMCLVPAPKNAEYVALSYVWGQTATLMTERKSLPILQEEGIFDRLQDEIAATIWHSIKLVPMLGEQFLWVDSLCIPQDDESSLDRHIGQMSQIYENATLTIVVAKGFDATSGLCGLRDVSGPRDLGPVLELEPNLTVSIRQTDLLSQSQWATRGWTMQEQIFSRRKLVFFENSVRWICRANTYYEDVLSPHNLSSKHLKIGGGELVSNFSPFDISLNVPDISVLCNLIANYNRRYLSFDRDVTSAFASAFSAMEQAFPRGFIHGLPVSFFDLSLLWRSRNHVRRRLPPTDDETAAPTWTWEGWQGYLHSLAWTTACYIKNPPFKWGRAHWEPFQAIPILTWYTRDTKDGPPRLLPFQNEWHEYKGLYMGKQSDLPDGWTFKLEDPGAEKERIASTLKLWEDFDKRCEDPDCKVSYEQLQTTYYYEHESCPTLKFWHPVPLGAVPKEQDQRPHLSYSRYLCAETQKACFTAARPRYNTTLSRAASYRGPGDYVVPMFGIALGVTAVFRDDKGEEVGELCVDLPSDLEEILDEENGMCCEVVAVSRGLNFPDPQPVEEETWSFMNVLWVSWDDGVAYRRGVGRVQRSAWEAVKKADVSLVLG
ncbi:heterokaryon incompatibility protein-domain-containing protein [Thelonectria olida]|uniref:Heterokaryon incompatibility protein-domain-containing protein n=1 Tax=Thelonectria olida TaxID=1576542 RepID=A0A9P8VWD0_9HYPO|nr:heterokaryon incompatibility protein-domain-containing protein [Thelonectria olida]